MSLNQHPDVSDFLDRADQITSGGTGTARRTDLRLFSQWYDGEDPTELTWEDVEAYLIHLLDEGYQDKTVERRFSSLSSLFSYLDEKKEVVEDDPTDKVDVSDLVDGTTMKAEYERNSEGVVYITPDEKEDLCEHVPAPQVRNELIVRLLWQTGLREHELRGIRLEDVDREERRIKIHSAKTHENRTVAYQPNLDLFLDQWIGEFRPGYAVAAESEYLFLTPKKQKMAQGSASLMVKKAAHDAGIQEAMGEDAAGNTRWRVTAHTLRHSHGVQAVKDDVQLRYIQKHMGHADLSTTEKYLRVTEEDVTDAMHDRFGRTE